uniref:GATA transcription factor n=1 Tax=Diospyros kaki TaxID=35925 RepID=A0A3S8T9B6_DIOKA|nr:transcription factor GATA2 [Diospyros kaki]
MDCMEARALKPSLLSALGAKSSQQALIDDLLCVSGITGVSSNDFSVDVFLDLSNEDYKDGVLEEEESEEEEKDSLSESSRDRGEDDGYNATTFSGAVDSGSLPSGELPLPAVDDLENLEWLSRFVDDSTSELSLLCPAGVFKEKTGGNSVKSSEPPVQKPPVLCFPPPVPVKARTKRPRRSGQAWSRGSPSSTPSSSSGSSPISMFVFSNPVHGMDTADEVVKPPAKKQKRPAAETGGVQTQRRCSHCQVQRTPQWRTGPLGPKTLCNACGVRYKSGRLFPEYRPACSPTFCGDMHSNSHRKVLEMRRKKDIAGADSVTASFSG